MTYLIFAFLLYIAYVDYATGIIPDKVILPGIAVLGLYMAFVSPLTLVAGVIGGAFFFLLFVVSQGKWIGGGDIRLGVFGGLVIGYPFVFAWIILSYLFGAIVAVFLLATKQVTLKTELPFAPYMVIALFVMMFFGEQVWDILEAFVGI